MANSRLDKRVLEIAQVISGLVSKNELKNDEIKKRDDLIKTNRNNKTKLQKNINVKQKRKRDLEEEIEQKRLKLAQVEEEIIGEEKELSEMDIQDQRLMDLQDKSRMEAEKDTTLIHELENDIKSMTYSNELREYLKENISKKKGDLECPICFEIAMPPIYRCSQFHLICSTCRSKVDKCGECREPYGQGNRDGYLRHRFAENSSEDLKYMEEKLDHINRKSISLIQIFVRNSSGKSKTIVVHPSDTITKVKDILYEMEGIPQDIQKLYLYDGMRYLQDGKTLVDLQIEKHSTLNMSVRPVPSRSANH